MARKSRKQTPNADIAELSKRYKTAVYARLSRERQKTEAIETQIKMVKDFVKNAEDMRLCGVFSDNGWSGTNFQRPGFIQLMEAVKNGEINCIAVKDLSRFGRTHIEVGDYLDKIFPFLGVRFAAIIDKFDSIDVLPEDLIITSFKNFAHAHFAKETSRKAITAKRMLQEKGLFVGSFTCFGYQKGPNDKHKIIENPETAPIVREIFKRISDGERKIDIINDFNARNIPTPSEYAKKKYGKNYVHYAEKWNSMCLNNIIDNEQYCGVLIQHKTELSFYDNIPNRLVSPNEQCRAEGIIPALVSREVWEKIQLKTHKKGNSKAFKSKGENIFQSLLFCKECGYRLQISSRKNGNIHYICPHCRKIKLDFNSLAEILTSSIKAQIKAAAEFETVLKNCKKCGNQGENTKILREITFLKNSKTELFNNFADGNISEIEFNTKNAEINAEIERLENSLTTEKEIGTETLDRVLKFRRFRKLTAEILKSLVSKIIISESGEIEIIFNFSDSFRKIQKFIERRKP